MAQEVLLLLVVDIFNEKKQERERGKRAKITNRSLLTNLEGENAHNLG